MQFSEDRIPTGIFEKFNENRGERSRRAASGSSARQYPQYAVRRGYVVYDLRRLRPARGDHRYVCGYAVQMRRGGIENGRKFDFAHYWEDICFKNGPLISPDMFEELCAKHYKKRNDLCRQYASTFISLDCDGVTDRLLPIWYENGVNTMYPIEIGTWGDQFEPARKKFGKGILGVGAMDKTALRKDKVAVDAEIERIKRLVDLGGVYSLSRSPHHARQQMGTRAVLRGRDKKIKV